MTSASSQKAIDQFWSAFLGVDEKYLTLGKTVIVPQNIEDSIQTIYLWKREDTAVVSCVARHPAPLVWRVTEIAGGHGPDDVFAPDFWRNGLGGMFLRMNGPVWVGVGDRSDFTWKGTAAEAHLMEADERSAIQSLADACDPAEVEIAGLDEQSEVLFGVYEDGGRLVALAGVESWTRDVAHVGVLVHPDFRRQGLGTAVVKAAAGFGLSEQNVILIRALSSNEASVAFATRLGFVKGAETISITVKE